MAEKPRPQVTGGFAPPAGAPYEVAQLLQPDAGGIVTAEGERILPADLAARNERQLQPLTYGRAGAAVDEAPGGGSRQDAPAVPPSGGVQLPRPVQAASPTPSHVRQALDASQSHVPVAPRPVQAAGPTGSALLAAAQERAVGSQAQRAQNPTPAASNTDSPSRGIPRATGDPNKQITGGFGDVGDAQYYPLDGSEALAVVWKLMDDVAGRVKNDLRFSPAITYARVKIGVAVTVECFPVDQSFEVARVKADERTPVEIASRLADDCVFVVRAERAEFDADGKVSTPPNAMRLEVGITPPRKQAVGDGNNRQIVDVVTS